MPTTIASPSNANTKIRYNEQYVSAGLNQKFAGPVPDGIIRGGTLQTTGAGFGVQINPDPTNNDSVYTFTTTTGFQLTHRESGIRVLDLTPVAGQTVYVALYCAYAINVPTVVEWRTYTEAELFGGIPVAEASTVVILGQVTVPGVAPIPSANVTAKRARRAWKRAAPGMRPWLQLVENGSFEGGSTTQQLPGYSSDNTGSAALTAVAGTSQHGEWYLNAVLTSGADVGRLGQGGFLNASPFSAGIMHVNLGQLFDVSFYIEGVGVPAYTAGVHGVRIVFNFYSSAGALLATEVVASDPATQVGTFSWSQVDRIFSAPVSGYVRWHIEISNNAGACTFHVDDLSILVEPRGGGLNELSQIIAKPRIAASMIELFSRNQSSLTTTNDRIVRMVAENAGTPGAYIKFMRGLSGTTGVRWLSSLIFDSFFDNTDATYGLLGREGTIASFDILHRYGLGSTGVASYARVFASSTNHGFVWTIGCSYDTGTNMWTRDQSGRPAIKMSLGSDVSDQDPTYLKIQHKNDPAPSTWDDNSWDRTTTLRANANGDIEYTTKIRRVRWLNLQEIMNFNWSVFGQTAWTLFGASFTNYIAHGGTIGQLWIPIPGFIPNGADLIDFQVGYQATGGSSVNPLALYFIRTDHDDTSSPLVVNAGQTTTIASRSHVPAQPVTEHLKLTDGAGLPHTLDLENYNYQLFFEDALQGGGSGTISYMKITWDDPGPGGR